MNILCPIHREGWIFLALFAAIAAGGFFLNPHLGWVLLILTAWCAYFFRDPKRVTPLRDGLIISPADGLIQSISAVPLPKELGRGAELFTRISVFMNVFDVHINRAPCKGTVKDIHYIPGKFFNASLDKASEDNERQIFTLALEGGKELVMTQIAGLVARRILRFCEKGDVLSPGQRYGMIRFGSRVDVYLPQGVSPLVIAGQKVYAGESVLADMQLAEPARQGHRQ